MRQLNIRLPDDRYSKLAALADRLGKTHSETARVLVDALLDAMDHEAPDGLTAAEVKRWTADVATAQIVRQFAKEILCVLPVLTDLVLHGRFEEEEKK